MLYTSDPVSPQERLLYTVNKLFVKQVKSFSSSVGSRSFLNRLGKKNTVPSELQIKWHFKANFEDILCQSYRNVNVML